MQSLIAASLELQSQFPGCGRDAERSLWHVSVRRLSCGSRAGVGRGSEDTARLLRCLLRCHPVLLCSLLFWWLFVSGFVCSDGGEVMFLDGSKIVQQVGGGCYCKTVVPEIRSKPGFSVSSLLPYLPLAFCLAWTRESACGLLSFMACITLWFSCPCSVCAGEQIVPTACLFILSCSSSSTRCS